MTDISPEQIRYLNQIKRHVYIVRTARIFILFGFLILWELAADTGIIDSFIFSSPSKIVRCFRKMVSDHTIFFHIWTTLYETIISFLLVTAFSILAAVLLWSSVKLSEILDPYLVVLNSLPKSALAPLLIVWLGANSKTIIVAGMSVAIFGSILNLYTEIQDCRPGKDQIDLHAPRHQTPCADKSHTAGFRSGDHQQHESQHRSVSGRCHHRRISRRQKRTRLPDHLLQSGLQNGLAADVDPSTLYHGDGTLCADQSG